MLVFAYGSNMHLQRMRSRVPSACPVTMGYVAHRQLAFHKRSADGSAKADAVFSAVAGQQIWGVLYRMDPSDKPALDEHEFLGVGYDQEQVVVNFAKDSVRAWMYVARREVIDPERLPYCWYLNYLILGAAQHGLPGLYQLFLQRFQSWQDPDNDRRAWNRQLQWAPARGLL